MVSPSDIQIQRHTKTYKYKDIITVLTLIHIETFHFGPNDMFKKNLIPTESD